jgi:hypothetical protein
LKDDNAGQRPAEPVLSDYDQSPGRVRLARSVLQRHAVAGDVHELVARRFVAEGFARVLDVGCGEGDLALSSRRHLGWSLLDRTPPGGVLGEATALPFLGESFDGVVPLLFGSCLELEVAAQNTDARARESLPP